MVDDLGVFLLGCALEVKSWPRYGMGLGKKMTTVGIGGYCSQGGHKGVNICRLWLQPQSEL